MGNVANINETTFPKQGPLLGRRAHVCFHYGSVTLGATIVRDDAESPWLTIISLDDGRIVLSTECQYSPLTPGFAQPSTVRLARAWKPDG